MKVSFREKIVPEYLNIEDKTSGKIIGLYSDNNKYRGTFLITERKRDELIFLCLESSMGEIFKTGISYNIDIENNMKLFIGEIMISNY